MDRTDVRQVAVVCQQLFHTSVPGRGFLILKSAGVVESLVPHVAEPIDPFGVASYGEGRAQYLLEAGGVSYAAISYLKKTLDDHSRPFIFNHTLIVSRQDYLRLGAHPQALESAFVTPQTFTFTGPSVDPLSVDVPSSPPALPSEEDLQRVRKHLPDPRGLTLLLSTLEAGRPLDMAVAGGEQEALQLVYSLLRVLPVPLRAIPFASFAPRVEYRGKFLLTAVPTNTRGATSQITSQPWGSQPSQAVVEMAQAVQAVDLAKLAAVWEMFEMVRLFADGLEAASGHLVAGRTKAAEAQLHQMQAMLSSSALKEEQKAQYQDMVLRLHLQRGSTEDFLAALQESTGVPDKLARIGQVVNDASVSPAFKHQLIGQCLQRYNPREPGLQPLLQFLAGNPAALPELVRAETVPLDRLLLALAVSRPLPTDLLGPLFQFDCSPRVLDTFERKQGRPYFVLCLDQLSRLQAFDASAQGFVASTLQRYIEGVRDGCNQVFRGLARQQWNTYARKVVHVLQGAGSIAALQKLAATWRADTASQKWNELLRKLRDVTGGA
ncbi:MAG: hypothetical protein HY535_00910 [Chloroflexi bacterium]|nr:hypothetical protein [Chloroflexota bacterium]